MFEFVSLWRYDPVSERWSRVASSSIAPVVMKPERRVVNSRQTDPVVHDLTDHIGLYWAEWKDDGRRMSTLVFSGPVLCRDVMLWPVPQGMIATCVPFADHATAMLVLDPKIHCRSSDG